MSSHAHYTQRSTHRSVCHRSNRSRAHPQLAPCRDQVIGSRYRFVKTSSIVSTNPPLPSPTRVPSIHRGLSHVDEHILARIVPHRRRLAAPRPVAPALDLVRKPRHVAAVRHVGDRYGGEPPASQARAGGAGEKARAESRSTRRVPRDHDNHSIQRQNSRL